MSWLMLQTVSAWQKTSKNTCTYASLFFLKHCEPKSSNDNLSIGIVAFAYFLRENLRRNSCISSTENNVWPVRSPNTLKLIKKKKLCYAFWTIFSVFGKVVKHRLWCLILLNHWFKTTHAEPFTWRVRQISSKHHHFTCASDDIPYCVVIQGTWKAPFWGWTP